MERSDAEKLEEFFAPRRPDWNEWKEAKRINLWQGVALACDLDPHQFMLGTTRLPRAIKQTPEKFETLLSMAINNLGRESLLKPLQLNPDAIEDTEVSSGNFGAWAKSIRYPLPSEFPWQDEAALPLTRDWPWGTYETELLRKLAQAAKRFWQNYDPTDATTAPTNEEVINWLVDNGVAKRTAQIMATILRADGLPTGPRK